MKEEQKRKLTDAYKDTLSINSENKILKERANILRTSGTKVYMEYSVFQSCLGILRKGKHGAIGKTTKTTLECAKVAARNNKDKKVCIINIGNPVYPGDILPYESSTQEAVLCCVSNLYESLNNVVKPVYKYNRGCMRRGLYTNNIVYSKDVTVFKECVDKYEYEMLDERDWYKVDCLSLGAINYFKAKECRVSREDISEAIHIRVKRAIRIAMEENVNTLIVGLYGHRIFGGNASDYVNIFKECLYDLDRYKNFDEVIFANAD